jgi:hypothetical protein
LKHLIWSGVEVEFFILVGDPLRNLIPLPLNISVVIHGWFCRMFQANSIEVRVLKAPLWLHRHIIGRQGANIRRITNDLPRVFANYIAHHKSTL